MYIYLIKIVFKDMLVGLHISEIEEDSVRR